MSNWLKWTWSEDKKKEKRKYMIAKLTAFDSQRLLSGVYYKCFVNIVLAISKLLIQMKAITLVKAQ